MTRLVVRPDGGPVLGAPPHLDRASRGTPRATALTVAVVGDCELVTQGLAHMLAPFSARVRLHHPVVRACTADAPESGHDSRSPDLILFDCYPGGRRDGVLRALPAPPTAPGSKVVAFTWETRADLVSAALQHGYCGYVAKSLSARPLVEALEALDRGERVVRVTAQPEDKDAVQVLWSREDAGLTQRELDVLDLIAAGHTNAEIATHLHVSINSVKSYVRSSYRKVGVTTRSQAVLWGISQGLGSSESFAPRP